MNPKPGQLSYTSKTRPTPAELRTCYWCRLWRPTDWREESGTCAWTSPRAPPWVASPVIAPTDGTDCPCHLLQRKRLVNLKGADAYLRTLVPRDEVTLRPAVRRVDPDKTMPGTVMAIVEHGIAILNTPIGRRHLRTRMSVRDCAPAGTLTNDPTWCLDLRAPIRRHAPMPTQPPTDPEPYLRSLRVNDLIPLIGWGGLHGRTLVGRVSATTPTTLTVAMGEVRMSVTLYRTGPFAGLPATRLGKKFWTLDKRMMEIYPPTGSSK